MKITESIYNVGVSDEVIDLFEGQFRTHSGMSYNSYVLLDSEIAVFDSVEAAHGEEWLENIKNTVGERTVDYLIVQHMEPDHSANIALFCKSFPLAKIVSTEKSFSMMKNFFSLDLEGRKIAVKEGDTLCVGSRKLKFISAPMVHWPEVVVVYDEKEKTLFSADAFGKFGSSRVKEEWLDEARRYYIGIVGKYGAQVQALLKKLTGLSVERICSLHGPVLEENIDE